MMLSYNYALLYCSSCIMGCTNLLSNVKHAYDKVLFGEHCCNVHVFVYEMLIIIGSHRIPEDFVNKRLLNFQTYNCIYFTVHVQVYV